MSPLKWKQIHHKIRMQNQLLQLALLWSESCSSNFLPRLSKTFPLPSQFPADMSTWAVRDSSESVLSATVFGTQMYPEDFSELSSDSGLSRVCGEIKTLSGVKTSGASAIDWSDENKICSLVTIVVQLDQDCVCSCISAMKSLAVSGTVLLLVCTDEIKGLVSALRYCTKL